MVVLGCTSKYSPSHDLTPLLKLAAENIDVHFVHKEGHWLSISNTFVRNINMLICTAQNPRYKEGWCVAAGMVLELTYRECSVLPLRIRIKRECYNSSLGDWDQKNSEFLEMTGLDSGLFDFQIEYPDYSL